MQEQPAPHRVMTSVRFSAAERELIERLKRRYGVGRIADLLRLAIHRLDEGESRQND